MTVKANKQDHDLLKSPQQSASYPAAAVQPEPLLPSALGQVPIEQIIGIFKQIGVNPVTRIRGARIILDSLMSLPGDTWADRWLLVDARSLDGGDWAEVVRPGCTAPERKAMSAALNALVVLDVLRPTHAWQHRRGMNIYQVIGHRDPEGTRQVSSRIDALFNKHINAKVRTVLAQIQVATGKTVRQITAQDLLVMDEELEQICAPSQYRRPIEHAWRVLTELGWIQHEPARWPRDRVRTRQMTVDELVDIYGIQGPQRAPLIEYLKQRSTALDYNTLRNLAMALVKNFWADITAHHPGLQTFALTKQMADGWKERIRLNRSGEPRRNYMHQLFVVRAFYFDMMQWALDDPYWVEWAARPPITRADLRGYAKDRRRQIARSQQRTRILAPVLPQLVAQADKERRQTSGLLAAAVAVGPGGTIGHDGQTWTVSQNGPLAPVRINTAGTSRNLTQEEDSGFWTWAIVEILRNAGIRCEELLELTHMSMVPYRLPATGEEIPLLHIAPSKTDEERLLVAGPELVNALAAVIHRVRGNHQDMPLTQRWDNHEHKVSPLLPHLICKPYGPVMRPVSAGTVQKLLATLAARADIRVNGEPVHFTPHDFRRIFATEALASGLPPHIVQVLLGHKNIATTQTYAAIYPEDVIRHHRTWIGQRRLTRPSEEYREPTPAEWEEFEAHFVKRKVSLGTCGRAYGTNCHHEHACVRCALLRPDPSQTDRLRDIVTNLGDRITEAEQHNWLGEVEGLKISLAAAEEKLAQVERLADSPPPTDLGMPRLKGRTP